MKVLPRRLHFYYNIRSTQICKNRTLDRRNTIIPCCSLQLVDHSSNRFFSSNNRTNTAADNYSIRQRRLGLALYRQLIRWCEETGDDIPLTSYVPPVTTMPPIVDEECLRDLADGNAAKIRDLLPRNSIIEHHKMTVPIQNCYDLKNLFRAMYRMNISTSNEEAQKDQISMGLKAVKSLNELTEALQEVRSKREQHFDREGVKYNIGQVVQHKTERWRGAILGWDRIPEPPKGQLTSLTTKDYSFIDNEDEENDEGNVTGDKIRYTMILDSGDAHLLAGRRKTRNDSGHPVVYQSDLELVPDVKLCRIRSNWIAKYFQRFDATSKCFVPNEARQFEFPNDLAHLEVNDMEHEVTATRNEIGASIVKAIQKLSGRLERELVTNGVCSISKKCSHVVANFQHRLSRLADGDLLTEEDRLTNSNMNDALLATAHLRWFLNLSLELAELLWQRKVAKETVDKIQYRLGDIVQHKKYGYRGVVVAWDSKPAVDVSLWDGLSEIDNPNDKPFYHIIPDQNDCLQAFGGERPFRYVCEENLEPCPRHRTILEVDLDPEWKNDPKTASYTPTQDLKFKHGEDIDDDGTTEQCLQTLYQDISNFYVAQRGLSDDLDEELTEIAKSLSAKVLFRFLKLANNLDTAIAVEESIKELWKAHPDADIRSKLDNGIADLLRGNKEKALVAFKELTVQDPNYAEAWNKASTCYFMLGDMQSSLEAAEEALALLPQHFQAMNGLGLIQYETRRYKLAAASFRQSLQMDPWSPVSSRLAACMDLLIGGDLADEIGAAEGTGPYD